MNNRHIIAIPAGVWAEATAIARQESGDKGTGRYSMSAGRVIMEAATGKRPPLIEKGESE